MIIFFVKHACTDLRLSADSTTNWFEAVVYNPNSTTDMLEKLPSCKAVKM